MDRWSKRTIMALILTALFGVGALAANAAAQDKAATPKSQNKHQLAQADVTRLLLLMDTDKNGKISRQEWMTFMAAEFDRLDTDKSGELDPKELALSRIQASTFSSVGK